MADTNPAPFGIEALAKIGVRLGERADAITQLTCQDLANDLRLASAITDKLSSLQFAVAEIAAKAAEQDDPAMAAVARDLFEAVEVSKRRD